MQIQGYDISTLGPLGMPRDKWHLDEKGISCTSTVLTLYATWTDVVPALYQPHPTNLNVLYRACDVAQEEDFGELCLVMLKYDQYYLPAATTATPQPQYGVNGSKLIQEITLHPCFSATAVPAGYTTPVGDLPWSQFWDATKKDWQSDSTGKYLSTVPSYLIGWTKWPDAAATVWTKVFYPRQPIDPLPEGQILDPGFGFGPSGCYVVDTCDQGKENAFWYRLTHFDYYPEGAPPQIFRSS